MSVLVSAVRGVRIRPVEFHQLSPKGQLIRDCVSVDSGAFHELSLVFLWGGLVQFEMLLSTCRLDTEVVDHAGHL